MKRNLKVASACLVLAVVSLFGFLSWGERSKAGTTARSPITVGPDGTLVVLRHDTWAAACIIANTSILTRTPTPDLLKDK